MMTVGSSSSAWRRKLGRPLAAVFGIVAVLLCAACGGSVPKTNYYTLQMPPPPPPVNDPKTNFTVAIERFRAGEMLRNDRIVYYESPTELNFYDYHRWSADPGIMLAQLVARDLEDMALFAQVQLGPVRELVDYVLRGRIFNFEEVDYEGGAKGRVGFELTLFRTVDRKVVWSANRQIERAAQKPGLEGVVNALSDASQTLLRDMLPGLAAEVERAYKESQAQPPPNAPQPEVIVPAPKPESAEPAEAPARRGKTQAKPKDRPSQPK